MNSPSSFGQKVVALCVLAILVVIALEFVIHFLERNWPWLLGIAILIAAVAVGIYFVRRGRGW